MKITFYGAAGEVTGSKHLITDRGSSVLLDCGLFQGRHDESATRNQLPFEAQQITEVVISHAHLDHVGLLPVLVKNGYTGKIYSTGATRDLAELILLDAAHLQEQDQAYAERKRWPGYERVKAIYTTADIPSVMARWEKIDYEHLSPGGKKFSSGLTVKLYDAGHILGSAVTAIESGGQRVVYTGDLGRQEAPLLRNPDLVPDTAESLIIEATYGNRIHKPVTTVESTLVSLVKETIANGSKIIVPAFALGRTQLLIYLLHKLTDEGILPRLPIYVDSPLAGKITDVFNRHQRDYDEQTARDFGRLGENPLLFRNLQFTHSVEESKALNFMPGPMMIICGSGMATGGRVLHHLANNLANPKNNILFTGYQAVGTLGRSLVEGIQKARLFGRLVPVNAKISILNDLSAHADAQELTNYAAGMKGLKKVFIVHAEPDRAAAFKAILAVKYPQWEITIPTLGQVSEI